MCDSLPDNYLILSVNRTGIDDREIRARYPEDVASRLLRARDDIERREDAESNSKYAATYRVEFVMSKKEGIPIHPTKDGQDVRIVSKLVNPEDKYPYRMKDILNEVNKRLEKDGICITGADGAAKKFNQYHFGLVSGVYGFKTDSRYSHNRSIASEKGNSYIYSPQVVDVIVEAVRKNPGHFVESMKGELDAGAGE